MYTVRKDERMTTIEFKYWCWKTIAVVSWFLFAYVVWNMSNQISAVNENYARVKGDCAQYTNNTVGVRDGSPEPGMFFEFVCVRSD